MQQSQRRKLLSSLAWVEGDNTPVAGRDKRKAGRDSAGKKYSCKVHAMC
jgi:hypothetical protein